MSTTDFRVAVFDMYDGHPNQGKRSIEAIVQEFAHNNNLTLTYQVFDTRGKGEVPDLSYDAFISTGGPGSPLDSEGSQWEKNYFDFIEKIRTHNKSKAMNKKPVFLICHSFQMFVRHYELAKVGPRKSTSFGVFPIHKTSKGKEEAFFAGLPDPFWGTDYRDFQVTSVNHENMHAFGARLLCREKERPEIPLERAVMAIRFTDYIFGTQFHPEADPSGMLHYFSKPDMKQSIVEKFGQEKFDDMMQHLSSNGLLQLTRNTVIPTFLHSALSFKNTLCHDQRVANAV
jgi:homoserine O-succinyltransferase/O-acetyltransferase